MKLHTICILLSDSKIEKELIEGSIEVKDIPKIWKAKSKKNILV